MKNAMSFPSAEEMRLRFHELADLREAVRAKSMPLRAQRDAIVNEGMALVRSAKPIETEYLAIEAELAETQEEFVMLVRALNGKTGERPAK